MKLIAMGALVIIAVLFGLAASLMWLDNRPHSIYIKTAVAGIRG